MLSELLAYSQTTHTDLCKTLDIDKGRLTRFLQCKYYQPRVFYDRLYDALEGKYGKVPRNEIIQAYPSGKAKGSWDIYTGEQYVATLVFKNINDVLDFVNKETRYMKLLEFVTLDTEFNNVVKIR